MSDDDSAVEGVIDGIDDDDESLSVSWGSLAASLMGIVSLGWVYGVVEFTQGIYGGIETGLETLADWISTEVVPEIFSGILDGWSTIESEIIEWVSSLGPAAPIGALIIFAFVTLVIVHSMRIGIRFIVGVT